MNEVNELQPMIIDSLESIEPGLKLCKNEVYLGEYGRLDILAKDKNDNFVIIELKAIDIDCSVIFQTLKYQLAISNNIEEFKRVYGVNGEPEVRIIIISPYFSPVTFGVFETYIPDLDMEFIEYTETTIRGNRELNFKKKDVHGHHIKPIKLHDENDIINFIKERRLRDGFRRVLSYLIKEGFEPDYHSSNNVVDFHYQDGKTGKKIELCRFETTNNCFKCSVPVGNGLNNKRKFTSYVVWFNLISGHVLKAKRCF